MAEVKFRELINPSILNAGWVGFHGDSEYITNGELKMGAWTFHGFIDDITNKEWAEIQLIESEIDSIEESDGINFTLDDTIEERLLYLKDFIFEVENDKGELCGIQFHYWREEDEREN